MTRMKWMAWGAILFISHGAGAAELMVEWQEGPPLRQPRGGHVAGWLAGKFVVVGGTYWTHEGESKKHWLQSVEAYDPTTRSWTKLPDLPAPVGYAAGAVLRDCFYVIGGSSDGESGSVENYCLAPQVSTLPPQEEQTTDEEGVTQPPPAVPVRYVWQKITPLPAPRVYAAAATLGDTLYLVGGATAPQGPEVTNTLWRYQAGEARAGWQTLASLPGPARAGHAAVGCAGMIFVFGGYYFDAQGNLVTLADAYRYLPERNHWDRLADPPSAVEGWTAVAYQERYILLLGGYRKVAGAAEGTVEGFVSDVVVYDTRTNRYSFATPLPQAVMDAQPAWGEGVLYLAGGEDRPQHRAPWLWLGRVREARGD